MIQRCSRWAGTTVGWLDMCGYWLWNVAICEREIKSAAVFLRPGICTARNIMLCFNTDTISLRISFIKVGSLDVFLFITWTTAMLSQWNWMLLLDSWLALISIANTMGKNSRMAIWYWSQVVGNKSQNQSRPKMAPWPILLASENRLSESDVRKWHHGRYCLHLKTGEVNLMSQTGLTGKKHDH